MNAPCFVSCLLLGLLSVTSSAMDQIALRRDGKPVYLTGKVITEAVDGGVLVMDREGVLWAVQPEELVKRTTDDEPYEPLKGNKLQRRLLEQLPAGFQIHATAHYVVCYNTSPAYAEWCGALFERLYPAFQNFWTRKGLALRDPPTPLVTVIFDQQPAYANFVRQELGEATSSIVAFYSLTTNRVAMYDLTGTHGLQAVGGRASTSAQINRLLMQPGAERMVATIIHEATHQLAYNCGMHQRFADIPLWVSEGLAVYFETPDLRSAQGWRTIGGVNRFRFSQFQQYLRSRDANSLESLLSGDGRFRKSETALEAYAEAWALNYFLLQQKSKEYVLYLQRLAERKPMMYDTPEERLAAFRQAFGGNLAALDGDFVRYLATKVR
jgi:hypothetical protein